MYAATIFHMCFSQSLYILFFRFLLSSVNFHDPWFPQEYEFPATLLEGIVPPHSTLKPEHMGHGRPGSYNPQIGFSQRPQRDFGAQDPAKRMIRYMYCTRVHVHVHVCWLSCAFLDVTISKKKIVS